MSDGMSESTYEIGLRGNDIARCEPLPFTGTLASAKRRATSAFAGMPNAAEIHIHDMQGDRLVSRRRLGEGRWRDVA